MKKLFIIIGLVFYSLVSYAQQWLEACENNNHTYYVSTSVRKRGSNYISFQKCVPKNLTAERNKLARDRGDNIWKSYAYQITTALVDIESYRDKTLQIVYYDVNGSVIQSFSYDDSEWSYAPPGTISECLCEAVEYIVSQR